MGKMIDNSGITATYGYSDLFHSYLSMVLCGGECAEDITEHLTGELSKLKGIESPSADTLLRIQKELVTTSPLVKEESSLAQSIKHLLKPFWFNETKNLPKVSWEGILVDRGRYLCSQSNWFFLNKAC
jgi:hypothetical protein